MSRALDILGWQTSALSLVTRLSEGQLKYSVNLVLDANSKIWSDQYGPTTSRQATTMVLHLMKQQRRPRDAEKTRNRIIDAAAKEFSERGFDGAWLSEIARRAKVSKQLINHHFGSKEKLFEVTHNERFLAKREWDEAGFEDPLEIMSIRFRRRCQLPEYMRFLAWEAASARNRTSAGEKTRKLMISQYDAQLRRLQKEGRIPKSFNPTLLHLAIVALSIFPLSFTQITKRVTGLKSSDAKFQREWEEFLRQVSARLLID